MAVPTYDQFIEPLLRYLAQSPDGVSAKIAHEETANALGLTDEDRQQLLPSGSQLIYKNRAGWAHDRLKRAGLSSSPRRGFWKPTVEGITFAMENQRPLPAALVEKLAMGYIGVKLKPDSGVPLPDDSGVPLPETIKSPPASSAVVTTGDRPRFSQLAPRAGQRTIGDKGARPEFLCA